MADLENQVRVRQYYFCVLMNGSDFDATAMAMAAAQLMNGSDFDAMAVYSMWWNKRSIICHDSLSMNY